MEREKITVEKFAEIFERQSGKKMPTLPEKGVLVAESGDNRIRFFAVIGIKADSWEEVVEAVKNMPLEQENLYYDNCSSNMMDYNTFYLLFSETKERTFFHSKKVEKKSDRSDYRGWDILKPFWELLDSFSAVAIPIRCDFMRTVADRWSPLRSKYRATVLAQIKEETEYAMHVMEYGAYHIRFTKKNIVAEDDGRILLSKKVNSETLDEIHNPLHNYLTKWMWKESEELKKMVALATERDALEKSLKSLRFFKKVVEEKSKIPNFLISWKPGRPKYSDLFQELRKTYPKGQAKYLALAEIAKWRIEHKTDYASLCDSKEEELARISAEVEKLNLIVQTMREEEENKAKKQWGQDLAAFLKRYSGVPIRYL